MKTGLLAVGLLLLLVLPLQGTSAQVCGVSVAATPSVVNMPGESLPTSQGLTFAIIFDVNYSTAFVNQTLTLQYLNGSNWVNLQNLVGNSVGFTEIDYGVNSAWAKFGDNTVRVVSGSCVSGSIVFEVRPDPTAAWTDVATYAAVAVLAVLFFVTGRKLRWARFLFLGAAVYLALSPFTGQRYDIYFLLSSGIRVLQHVNPFDPGSPAVYPGSLKWAYPPLYTLYSAFAFVIYQALTGASLPGVQALTYPGWLTSTYSIYQAFVPGNLPVLVLFLKLPMIASALATGILLKKMTGDDSAAVQWIANPLVILVAAVWGQLDPIATLLAVASLYCFQKNKMYHAYLLASLGAAVKIWPALMIPFMFAISLRKEGRNAIKPIAAIVPAALVSLALYTLFGNLVDTILVFVYARGIPTFAGAFSVNGLTWQEALFVMKSPPIPLFLVVGIPAYAAALAWTYWKDDRDLLKWTVVSILLFFLTYNYVNPQYFYWIIPLLILQRRRIAAMAFTFLPLLYMLFSYDIFYFVTPAFLSSEFSLGASIADQLKVTYFYQNLVLFVFVSGVIPTVAYAVLLYSELRSRRAAESIPTGGVAKDEKGLVAEPVEGEDS